MARSFTVALFALFALLAGRLPAPARAGVAPVNLAPNSQWEIFSGLGYGPRENVEGTGAMAPIAVAANTTGDNRVTFTVSGSTGELENGELVTISGPGVDPALTVSPMRVFGLIPDRRFQVLAPLGRAPAISRPAVAQPVGIGMATPGNLASGDAADGWSKGPGGNRLVVWREDNPVNLSPGAMYALGVNMDGDGAPQAVSTGPDARPFRGKTIAFGAYVLQKVRGGPGTWQAFIVSDGAAAAMAISPMADPRGGYQWREVSYRVPDDATTVSAGVRLNGAPADTYYVTDPVLTVGGLIGPDNYIKPRETLIPVVHISPLGWINATIAFPKTGAANGAYAASFDIYAETGGAVAPSVKHAFGEIEGIDSGAVQAGTGAVRVMAFLDKLDAPEKSGSFLAQAVQNVKAFNVLDLPLATSSFGVTGPEVTGPGYAPYGYAVYVTGVPGDVWWNVSMEFDGFLLN